MISEIAKDLTNAYKKSARLYTTMGIILLMFLILIPKNGLLFELRGPILTILVEILLGFFVGTVYYILDTKEQVDLDTWLYKEEDSTSQTEKLEKLKEGSTTSELIDCIAFLTVFMLVLFTGTASYAYVWHEIETAAALSEFAFHLIRAAIFEVTTFIIGLFYGRRICQRLAREIIEQ